MHTILVTAIGGDLGQSIVRVLRRFELIGRIIGCDMDDDNPAEALVDVLYTVPPAKSRGYLRKLEELVERESLNLIIPASEPELKVIYYAWKELGWEPALLVIPRGEAVPICLDKLNMVRFLSSIGLPAPWTIPVTEGMPLETPCILKDRQSSGSRSIMKIENQEMAQYYARHQLGAIFQELLLPVEEEYTCGVFRSKKGEVKTVAFKRRLIGGVTGKAIVTKDDIIDDLCCRIVNALNLQGSINIQLRKTKRGPIPFEINPRFSSTVIFRELIGFRDLVWSILDLMGEEFSMDFSPPVGTRIYRVFNEIVIPHHR